MVEVQHLWRKAKRERVPCRRSRGRRTRYLNEEAEVLEEGPDRDVIAGVCCGTCEKTTHTAYGDRVVYEGWCEHFEQYLER